MTKLDRILKSRDITLPTKVHLVKAMVSLCDPVDCSPPGSSVHRILQARILEWVAMSFSRDLPDPGIELKSPALAGGFFTAKAPWQPPNKLYIYTHVYDKLRVILIFVF